MNESTVTITLDEYNQLRDNAVINHMLLDKIISYEGQVRDMDARMFEIINRMCEVERKLKPQE